MEQATAVAVARRFCGPEPGLRVERHTRGHIHDTWFVARADGTDGLVLQRLNNRIFADPVQVMDNVLRVTNHLRHQLLLVDSPDPDRRVLTVVRTRDGDVLVYDDDGRPWRAYKRVPRARSHDAVATSDAAAQVGHALGRFFAAMQHLPGPRLPETIPGFKDFARRREDFELVVEVDAYDRVSTCRAEIEAVRSRHRLVDELRDGIARGHLPERTVHNDAKSDNVLLDDATGEGLCVIDLDTTGPGTVLFDVGDLLRSATVTSVEDATDLGGLGVRDDLLDAALCGYLAEAGDLSRGELDLLPLAGPLMAYENALRFLSDYLVGDTYYRVTRPGQNLDRARAQLRVLEALRTAEDRVAELVRGAVW